MMQAAGRWAEPDFTREILIKVFSLSMLQYFPRHATAQGQRPIAR